MREYERRQSEQEGKDAHGASPANTEPSLRGNSGSQPAAAAASAAFDSESIASSSAQDQGSESSVSDFPVSVINYTNLNMTRF